MLVPDREQRFWASVPRPFMERFLRSLFDNYLLADHACQDFDNAERRNLRPFYRRALIKRSIRGIAEQFPEHVVAEAVRYEDKGFWFHTRVICNGDVALTQNTVPYPHFVVRNSYFRDCYASPSNQLYLFPDLAPEQLPSDSLLYGIIVHGKSAESPLFPGFAQVRFPKPGLAGYHLASIDLFDEFSEVVVEKTTELPGTLPDETELEPELLDPFNLPNENDWDTEQFGT